MLKKWEDIFYGNTAELELKMTVHRPQWTREVQFKTWTHGLDYALVVVREPARDKGTAYLKRSSEMWNWIPSIDRTVKMPPSLMGQSWMGSDLSHDDLVHKSSLTQDYQARLLGTETLDGQSCKKIELIPEEDAAVVWGKLVIWINTSTQLAVKTEFYDEDLELVHTMHLSQVKNLGGRNIPTRLEVIPAGKTGHSTVVEYLSAAFDKPFSLDFFSLQNLKTVQ